MPRIYCSTQEISLKVCNNYTHGDHVLKQFEKAESSSKLIYTIITYVFENLTFLIQVIISIYLNNEKYVFIGCYSLYFYCFFLNKKI